MAKKPKAVTLLEQLTPDPDNRRQHTQRGARMLVDALTRVGAARSIVIDETGTVLAGNGVVEAAGEVGITKVQVVDADGQTLIAVRRSDLTPEQKRELAMFDNRAPELAAWRPEQLAADKAAGVPLTPFFDDKELAKILKPLTGPEAEVSEVNVGDVHDRFWIAVAGPLPQQALALQKIRELMQDLAGVTVELGTVPQERWG